MHDSSRWRQHRGVLSLNHRTKDVNMRQSEAAPAWINGILPPLAAAAAFICVGLSVVATRYAVAQHDTLTVAFFRNGLAFVLLFPFLRQQIRRARAIAMEAIMIAESVRQMVDDIDHADITQTDSIIRPYIRRTPTLDVAGRIWASAPWVH